MYLIGRNRERLDSVAGDLAVRGASHVETRVVDLLEMEKHPDLIEKAFDQLGSVNVVLIAHGLLGDQKKAEQDSRAAEEILNVNFNSTVLVLTQIANRMERQKSGTIAVITSVAADRGRQSNYVYGSAKAGLNVFLQGMRNRLFKANVKVLTVKPGFVDTPMTSHLRKSFLFSSDAKVAECVYKGITKGNAVN